jgi:hypothetical protein
VSTWIRRPADKPSRRWHLEAVLPPTPDRVFAACGLSWAPTDDDPLERTEDLARIRDSLRCEACDAVYVRHITEP